MEATSNNSANLPSEPTEAIEPLQIPRPKRVGTDWTPELEQRLKKLWTKDKETALACAQILNKEYGLNLTRNAISGKVNRMGLADHTFTNKANYQPIPYKAKKDNSGLARNKPRKKHNDGIKIAPTLPQCTPIETQPLRISLMELTSTTCRYPLGTPGEPGFSFCGLKTDPTVPYCREHLAICYSPTARR